MGDVDCCGKLQNYTQNLGKVAVLLLELDDDAECVSVAKRIIQDASAKMYS